jgi:hypothetical protein
MVHHRSTRRRKHYRRKSRKLRGGSFWLPIESNAASYTVTGQGNAGTMNTNFGDLAKQSATVAAMPNPNNTLTAIKASVVPNATSLSSIQSAMTGGSGDLTDAPVAVGTPMKTSAPMAVAYGTPMKTSAPLSGGLLDGGGRRQKRRRRGGNVALGAVVSKAAVPFSLLGMQQMTRRPRRKHSRRSHSRRR